MASLFQNLFHPNAMKLDSRTVVQALATETMGKRSEPPMLDQDVVAGAAASGGPVSPIRALVDQLKERQTASPDGAPKDHAKALVNDLRDRERRIAGLNLQPSSGSSVEAVRARVAEALSRKAPENYEDCLIRQGMTNGGPDLLVPSQMLAAWLPKAMVALPKPPGMSNEAYRKLISRFSIACGQKGRKGPGYQPSAIREAMNPRLR
jgi:hypothetical protein